MIIGTRTNTHHKLYPSKCVVDILVNEIVDGCLACVQCAFAIFHINNVKRARGLIVDCNRTSHSHWKSLNRLFTYGISMSEWRWNGNNDNEVIDGIDCLNLFLFFIFIKTVIAIILHSFGALKCLSGRDKIDSAYIYWLWLCVKTHHIVWYDNVDAVCCLNSKLSIRATLIARMEYKRIHNVCVWVFFFFACRQRQRKLSND